ncbi:V-type ATP synthase subunit D [Microbispora sp. NBC_01189]|uniref:V-type ATP synthase subunit D n=1 Tax=Microbispora sp. NBC_01189 TaxID=2903583 RepID=UPI002E14DD53|nr:V-type ATP synthase subunit D [Microbispora sp. NBC_01189]
MRIRVPPGRAGRLWLRHRLAVLRHGLAVLDRKLRILRRERDRLAREAARTGREWEEACRAADAWASRAALLGGRRAIRLACDGRLAEVRVDWTDAMGTRYPRRALFRPPDEPGPSAPLPLTAALVPAREACRAALRAAVDHAVAAAAARVVAAEEEATGRRIRALRDHVLPRLEAALAEVELSLDEAERADGARVRRAAAAREAAAREIEQDPGG